VAKFVDVARSGKAENGRDSWWKRKHELISGLSALANVFFALALVILARQTVDLEKSQYEAQIVPVAFYLCIFPEDGAEGGIASFSIMNTGLQATSLDVISVEALANDGAKHNLVASAYEVPPDGGFNLTNVGQGNAQFSAYLQPGQKEVGILYFPDQSPDELLGFYRLTASFDPVIGKSQTISIGNGHAPIGLPTPLASCYG
jgi:hypothetical protein